MRFLIFNVVVVGALFYLFAGSQPFGGTDRNGMLGTVGAVVERSVTSGRQATAAVIDKVMAGDREAPLPSALTPPDLKTPPTPMPVVDVPVQKVVPPILATLSAPKPPAITAKSPVAVTDPAVQKRRAEVMARGPVASVAAVKARPKFMTPSQRRRELQALSEDMELLFASTRAR